MFESFVANRHAATGVIQWMFNSAWPKLWWQLYDYYLRPNGALYGARKAGEPLHILYDYGTRDVVVSNGTREEAARLRAEIRVFDIGLKERYSKSVEFSAAPDQVQKLDTLPVPEGTSEVSFVDLRLFKDKNTLVDTNFYCLSAKEETLETGAATWYVTPVKDYADFTALEKLGPAKLRIKDKFSTAGPVTQVSLEIENNSKNLAFFVELDIERSETGEAVAPIFWDDNYITLLPGEKRKIGGALYTEDLFGEKPVLKVKGWNLQK
jgi:exo-1,4-beta-D-glucosaminidase